MIEIRGSEVSDFLRCRYRWEKRWKDGLKPKKKNDKLFFGTLFHKFLETYHKTNNFENAFEDMQIMAFEQDSSGMEETDYTEMLELLTAVAENYHEHWKDKIISWKTLATELRFRIPLANDICYTGTIDLIFQDSEGNTWFVDHKTTTSINKYVDNSVLDRQISRYWWALQELSEGNGEVWSESKQEFVPIQAGVLGQPFGFIYNIILKDVAEAPKKLQKGGYSVAKTQKTTYELYYQALANSGLEKEETYQEFLDYLKGQKDRFFKQVKVFRNKQEIEASIREMTYVIADMVSPNIYRNVTSDCSWDCQFKELCTANLDGSNERLVEENLYEKKENPNAND
jgi:hypothetical protein